MIRAIKRHAAKVKLYAPRKYLDLLVLSSKRGFTDSVFQVLETLFLLSLPWQTRLNLSHLIPQHFTPPVSSDYLYAFIYLSQILFGLTFIIWLATKWQLPASNNPIKPRAYPNSNSIFLSILLITLLLVLSYASNSPQWWNLYTVLGWLQGLLLAFFVYKRLTEGAAQKYLLIGLLGLFSQQLLAITQWFLQHSLGLQWLGEWRYAVTTPGIAKVILQGQEFVRSYGTFAHPNILGGILAATSIPGLLYVRQHLAHHPRWPQLHTTFLAISTLAIILTFSRVAWLLYGFSLLIYLLSQFWPHHPLSSAVIKSHTTPLKTAKTSAKRLTSTLRQRTLVFAVLIILSITISTLIIPRLVSTFSYDRITIDRRLQLNQVAHEVIQQYPWFGIGPGNFMLQVYSYGPLFGVGIWRQPVHNIFLLLASEVGLLITTAIIFLLAHLVYQLATLYQKFQRPQDALLLWVWLVIITTGIFDHYWLTIQPAFQFLVIILGASIYSIKHPPTLHSINPSNQAPSRH